MIQGKRYRDDEDRTSKIRFTFSFSSAPLSQVTEIPMISTNFQLPVHHKKSLSIKFNARTTINVHLLDAAGIGDGGSAVLHNLVFVLLEKGLHLVADVFRRNSKVMSVDKAQLSGFHRGKKSAKVEEFDQKRPSECPTLLAFLSLLRATHKPFGVPSTVSTSISSFMLKDKNRLCEAFSVL